MYVLGSLYNLLSIIYLSCINVGILEDIVNLQFDRNLLNLSVMIMYSVSPLSLYFRLGIYSFSVISLSQLLRDLGI